MAQSTLHRTNGSETLLESTRALVDTARETCASIDALSAKFAKCRERLEASTVATASPFALNPRP